MTTNSSLKIYKDSKVKTAAIADAITTAEAKKQLNIEASFTDDDTLIAGYLSAATAWLQDRVQVQFMQATWYLVMNAWTYEDDFYLQLPWSPLVAVSSVKYYDVDDELQTLATSEYQLNTYSMPGKIRFTGTLPELYDRPDAIIIEYVAGYGAAAANEAAQQAAVPQLAKNILKIKVTDFYDQRGEAEYKESKRLLELCSTLKVFLKC